MEHRSAAGDGLLYAGGVAHVARQPFDVEPVEVAKVRPRLEHRHHVLAAFDEGAGQCRADETAGAGNQHPVA